MVKFSTFYSVSETYTKSITVKFTIFKITERWDVLQKICFIAGLKYKNLTICLSYFNRRSLHLMTFDFFNVPKNVF